MYIDRIELNVADVKGVQLAMAPLHSRRPHEEIDPPHVTSLAKKIVLDDMFTTPIVVCRDSFVILDGHHRFTAMRDLLKARCIPAYLIDYQDNHLSQVGTWRENDSITKRDVSEAGLSGNLMAPKRSKHRFCFPRYLASVPLMMLSK